MRSVDGALLFILIWTLMAVCRANDDCSVSCDDVTGTVGSEVTLTCSVSQQCTDCCITMYKFQYPKKLNDSAICREETPVGSCDERNTFTCSFTPTTAMKGQFRFYLVTKCGTKRKGHDFTLNITERSSVTDEDPKVDIITAGVASSILILIIILTIILYKCQCIGFVRQKMFQGVRQDEDNPESPL